VRIPALHPLVVIVDAAAGDCRARKGVYRALIESYGMTEAAHQMASNPLPPAKRIPGSVGIAAGPEVAIMDDRRQPAARGRDWRES
jgi:acyl-CoA synthetase (AMP-forming)/AMP-acid ligase II